LWDRIEASIDAAGPSPALWARIEAATTPAVIPLAFRRRLRFWQAGTGVSLAIAASLAAFILLNTTNPPRIAVLMPMTGGVPVLLATAAPGGELIVRPQGTIRVPGDRDLELWALSAGETRPRSLGVMPATGRQLKAALPPGTRLLVSLEPRGGSPTGQPTGPVLYGGQFTARE
jgi:anti-sigma-K factor RskA